MDILQEIKKAIKKNIRFLLLHEKKIIKNQKCHVASWEY